MKSKQTIDTFECFSIKTHGKILKESLILFNESGFNTVTTSLISKQCDILEGTLWYHFNSKKKILFTHIDFFEKLFNERTKNVDFKYLNNIFAVSFDIYSLIWDFQYIFREHFEFFSNDKELLKRVEKINVFIDNYIKNLILQSQKHFINFEKSNLDTLVDSTLMMGRYWLHFAKKRYKKLNDKELKKKGIMILMDYYRQFLDDKAFEDLSKFLKRY